MSSVSLVWLLLTVSLFGSKSFLILKKFFPCCFRPRTNFFYKKTPIEELEADQTNKPHMTKKVNEQSSTRNINEHRIGKHSRTQLQRISRVKFSMLYPRHVISDTVAHGTVQCRTLCSSISYNRARYIEVLLQQNGKPANRWQSHNQIRFNRQKDQLYMKFPTEYLY